MLTTYLQDDDIRSYFRFKAFAKTPNQNAINMVTRVFAVAEQCVVYCNGDKNRRHLDLDSWRPNDQQS